MSTRPALLLDDAHLAPTPAAKRARKPKVPPAPTREELAAQIAQGLPETEADLVSVVWDVARRYDAAVIQGQPGNVEFELERFEAVVFKLNGNTFFGCNKDDNAPTRRMVRATAADVGASPLWGQSGDFLITVEDIRARVIYPGLAGIGVSGNAQFEFHIVDLDRPFPSDTGFRCEFTDRGVGLTVAARATEVFAKMVTDLGLKMVGERHAAFLQERRQADPAFRPGGYLADLVPLPPLAAPLTGDKGPTPEKKRKRVASKASRKSIPGRAILSVSWRRGRTPPPADVETLPDGRTLWACIVLDRAHEKEIGEYAPTVELGSGWASCWTPISPPPKRWGGQRKADMRRRNLRARLDKRMPLLAALFEAQELERRPHYFDAAAIESGDDARPVQAVAPQRPVRMGRPVRPDSRFEQLALDLAEHITQPPTTIPPSLTAGGRAAYRAARYEELMAQIAAREQQGVVVAERPADVCSLPLDFTAHRHPSMAVGCPTCGAGVGAWCKRPSGHRAWGDFHKERHQAADREWFVGAYPVIVATDAGFAYAPAETDTDLATWQRARADYLHEVSYLQATGSAKSSAVNHGRSSR